MHSLLAAPVTLVPSFEAKWRTSLLLMVFENYDLSFVDVECLKAKYC